MDCYITTDADSSKMSSAYIMQPTHVLDKTAKFTSLKLTQKIINIQIKQQRRQQTSLPNSAINIKK